MKTRNCPVCGSSPFLDKKPLWRDYGYTTHGYVGEYTYNIRCANADCPCSLVRLETDTMSSGDDKQARANALNKWNEYVLNVEKIMEENKK